MNNDPKKKKENEKREVENIDSKTDNCLQLLHTIIWWAVCLVFSEVYGNVFMICLGKFSVFLYWIKYILFCIQFICKQKQLKLLHLLNGFTVECLE